MKILLIRPPVPKFTIGLKNIMICEPLELEYVAAGITGHEVRILDLILEKGLSKCLVEFKPDIVGTSCYINGVNEVIKICRQVKMWDPYCTTVVGGVQASKVPQDFSDPSVDCIVLGDGTSIIQEIVNAVQYKLPLNSIPGLAFPCGNNEVCLSDPRNYMFNADLLPLPRRDLTKQLKSKYYYLFHQPVALMKTTWGCWYRCNFCYTWQITSGNIYSRSPESIVDELNQIDCNDIYIVDDIFLINPSRLFKLAELIRKNNIKKNYLVYSRADFIVSHPEIVKEWAEIGLKAVFIGLEASTDPELDSMNKECTVDFNRRSIEILRQNKIDTYGSLIPQPDYDVKDWDRLYDFIEKNNLYYVNISPLTPIPGTDIWDQYKDKIIVSRKAHSLWDFSHSVLPTKISLKKYYRLLLKTYTKTCLNIRRANKLSLRTRPPIFSYRYIRLWLGAIKIFIQFFSAHKHHRQKNIIIAENRGIELINSNASQNNLQPKKLIRELEVGRIS